MPTHVKIPHIKIPHVKILHVKIPHGTGTSHAGQPRSRSRSTQSTPEPRRSQGAPEFRITVSRERPRVLGWSATPSVQPPG
jgi:hypothetical protein